MKVTGPALSGPARLFLVIVIGWIAVWGAIYVYGTMTAAKAQQDGSEALREMTGYTDPESQRLMGQAVHGGPLRWIRNSQPGTAPPKLS